MAFNPFHKFRKHKKAIFAALTIFCMFSFVACSGLSSGGDMASWLTSLVMGRAKQVDLATIDGTEVTHQGLYQTEIKRKAASQFMMEATNTVINILITESQAGMEPGTDRRIAEFHIPSKPQ